MKLNSAFDEIYVINLKRRPDRLVKILAQLNKLGVTAKVIEAVDGQQPEVKKEYFDYYNKPLGTGDVHEFELAYGRKMIDSPGAWAYLKTWEKIIVDAKSNHHERILCLDDDACFHKKFNHKFHQSYAQIPANWKLLYLGATQHTWNFPKAICYQDKTLAHYDINQPFYHPLFTDGSFAVGVSNDVYDEILAQIRRYNCSLDSGPLRHIMKNYQDDCYVLQPNLVIADVAESDIREGRDNVAFAEKMKWDLSLYTNRDKLPLVSVIMPAYNAENTIGYSIESILKQDYPKIEIIVVDDCSADRTAEVAQHYAEIYPQVKFIGHKKNQGCYAARNNALRIATGKYITVQDADDYSLPDRISRSVIPLMQGCGFSIGRILRSHVHWNEVEKMSHEEFLHISEERRIHRKKDGSYKYCCQHIVALATVMYRRDIFEKLGLFWEEAHSMDAEFVERFLFDATGRILSETENIHSMISENKQLDDIYYRIDHPLMISFQMEATNITNAYKNEERIQLRKTWRERLMNVHPYEYPVLEKTKRKKSAALLQNRWIERQQYFVEKVRPEEKIQTVSFVEKLQHDKSENLRIKLGNSEKIIKSKDQKIQDLQELIIQLQNEKESLAKSLQKRDERIEKMKKDLNWFDDERNKLISWSHEEIEKMKDWHASEMLKMKRKKRLGKSLIPRLNQFLGNILP